MKILWKKTNQNKQRVFRLLFRRKKINGARKEIFLNEKKKQFCMMLNYKSAPKQTHKMMIYIYSFNFYNNKKPNNFTKFLKEIYIYLFFFIIIILFSFFNYFFSSLFCPCHLITKVCESLLRYTCMNVVCKIEHIKKPWSLLQKKKSPQKFPPQFFFLFVLT